MTPVIAFSTISNLFAKHRSAIQKFECDVNASATFPVYVQLIDWPTPADLAANLSVPANGAVPVKSWPVPTGQNLDIYKEFKNGILQFRYGVFAVVSTTQATLTIGTGSNKFDSVAVELLGRDQEQNEAHGAGVNTQQVWSDANGTAANIHLIRVAARNLTAGVRYLMLYAVDSPANGSTPLRVWTLAANGDSAGGDIMYAAFGQETLDIEYGAANDAGEGRPYGLFVRSQDSSLVNHQGCTFVLSTTETTLTLDSGSGMNIFAEFR